MGANACKHTIRKFGHFVIRKFLEYSHTIGWLNPKN
jgi:hypothetical protein